MKNLLKNGFGIKIMIAVLFCGLLSSFDTAPGGDTFTIYLNDKLLVKQFVHLKEKTQTISLQEASANDILKIHYSHCGEMGIARTLELRDVQNRIVKAWKFENSKDGNKGAMTVRVSEIGSLQKKSPGEKLSLRYSSEQLPDGIILATLSTSSEGQASIR